jgi:hypothetical protein
MKNFLLGLGLGVGLGYYFHDDITNALLQTAGKADEEKPAELDHARRREPKLVKPGGSIPRSIEPPS